MVVPKYLYAFPFLICSCLAFDLYLLTPEKPIKPQQQHQPKQIYSNSVLSQQFNDTEYGNKLTCTNGLLTIVELNNDNYSILQQQPLSFKYTDLSLSEADVLLSVSPNQPNPRPSIIDIDDNDKIIQIASGCLDKAHTNSSNYYNKLKVTIIDRNSQRQTIAYNFQMLYNCDYNGRNKKFEYGYLLLTVLNAVIIIGVALHSRIWSIRYNNRPLCIELKWYRFLILTLSYGGIFIAIYFYASKQFKTANFIMTYLGLAIGWIFTTICANQILFLINSFKKQLEISQKLTIRVCDILSICISTTLIILTAFFQIWILLDIISVCICVGAIKLFQFSSLKQATITMVISVFTVVVGTSIMHFILDRSYNDYANQMASSLFLVVPDLIDTLFKKCSWIPILDVILPGVYLSYLRGYDENYNTGWGGVYTVVGNISFLIGTAVWIPIEGVYFFSVPFSMVTYPFLMLGVFIIGYKRNQYKTLWTGRFNGPHNQFSQRIVQVDQSRTTFGKLLDSDLLDQMKIKQSSDMM